MTTSQVIYNYLGSSGLKIANFVLGTATFGNDPAAPLVSIVGLKHQRRFGLRCV